MLEYVVGSESHTSNWGRFHVRGLELIQAPEDHESNRAGKHHYYQCYVANPQPGKVFTVLEQDGSRGKTDLMKSWICKVSSQTEKQDIIKARYGNGVITGNFEIVAVGETLIKARRLLEWWTNKPQGVNRLAYASHCAQYITKRGVAVLPEMPAQEPAQEPAQ